MTACSHGWGLTWSTDTTLPTSLNQYDSGLRTFTCSITQEEARISSTHRQCTQPWLLSRHCLGCHKEGTTVIA